MIETIFDWNLCMIETIFDCNLCMIGTIFDFKLIWFTVEMLSMTWIDLIYVWLKPYLIVTFVWLGPYLILNWFDSQWRCWGSPNKFICLNVEELSWFWTFVWLRPYLILNWFDSQWKCWGSPNKFICLNVEELSRFKVEMLRITRIDLIFVWFNLCIIETIFDLIHCENVEDHLNWFTVKMVRIKYF
jgi:hypothetical protein